MENVVDKIKKEANPRVQAVRFRAWSLTVVIIIALILYFFVQVATKQEMSLIDFVLLCTLQIVVYSIYFPEGDLYGSTNQTFINNKKMYNMRATQINKAGMIGKLRDYCEYDYEKRKREYIETQCGYIGISIDELEELKKDFEDKKSIKKLERIELFDKKDKTKSRLIFFNSSKRRILYNLLFKEIPVERNHPETIMSAVEYSGVEAAKDKSIRYRTRSYTKKILTAITYGAFFAYIGITARDGFGIAEITSIFIYLTTILTNAVMAYNAGEVCSRVYKNQFYVELTNFIEAFLEWSGIEIDKIEQKE